MVMLGVPAGSASNSLRRNTGLVIARPLRIATFPLEVSDFDLENGILILDENKTDEPRRGRCPTSRWSNKPADGGLLAPATGLEPGGACVGGLVGT